MSTCAPEQTRRSACTYRDRWWSRRYRQSTRPVSRHAGNLRHCALMPCGRSGALWPNRSDIQVAPLSPLHERSVTGDFPAGEPFAIAKGRTSAARHQVLWALSVAARLLGQGRIEVTRTSGSRLQYAEHEPRMRRAPPMATCSAGQTDGYPSRVATKDKIDLSGKVAFITGGASGIGAALTSKLTDAGAEVWIADRQFEVAGRLAQRLGEAGAAVHAIELDVRDHCAFEQAISQAVHVSGRIDYLFNNAGIGIGGEVDTLTLDDWNDIIDVNLRGVIHGVQAAYPVMIGQGSGHIVNTASMAGLVTTSAQAGYSATKHAVVALSKTMRVEAATHGVQVSVLCPGVVRTPILAGGEYGRHSSVSRENLLKLGEALRPMEPDAFAERALHAVLRNRAIIVVPQWWKALWYLERVSPALSMRTAGVALRRTRQVQSTVTPK